MIIIRRIFFYIRNNERMLRQKARAAPKGFIAWVIKSGVLHFDAPTFAAGTAIGMFWALVPMPFQMVPATLFCVLARANLPVAIACVWISNPLTYAPIFYMQYKIGLWLFGSDAAVLTWEYFSAQMSDDASDDALEAMGNLLKPVLATFLKGALFTCVFFSALGYAAGILIFRYEHVAAIADKKRDRQKKLEQMKKEEQA